MAKIKINISEIVNSSSKGNSARSTVESVEYGIGATKNRIDSKILSRNSIGRRISNVQSKVGQIEADIAEICAAVNAAALQYQDAENRVIGYANIVINDSNRIQVKSAGSSGKFSAYFHDIPRGVTFQNYADNIYNEFVNPNIIVDSAGNTYIDWNKIVEGVTCAKPYIISSLLGLVSPITGLLYITSGIPYGNIPSFSDKSRVPSASASAGWLGYEFAEDNPGVTAWVGKASAQAQNEWAYAGVNAYLGKAEAEAKAEAGIMKTTTKKEYKDGKWSEKTTTEFITAEVGASAGVSVLAADAEAGVGSDMLGVEGNVEGAAGTAKAEVKGEFSIGEDGVNANVGGEAMVAAVEGEASGTINILGIEITGKVGGYAGAVGVEGKIGIENNKFVAEGGVAALLGFSTGVEIGFNEEGWDNFVDFITFWD